MKYPLTLSGVTMESHFFCEVASTQRLATFEKIRLIAGEFGQTSDCVQLRAAAGFYGDG